MATGIIRRIIDYGKSISGEAVRYVIIGACTTLLNFVLFAILTGWFDTGTLVANLIAIPCSIVFAYVTNKLIVFRKHSGSFTELVAEFLKFVFARLFTMALEVGAVELTVTVLGQHKWLGKAEAQVLVVIANYVISKTIVFRNKKNDRF